MPPLKRRILCVDDDEDTCEALTQLLKRENYEARSVDNIQAALDLAHKESFNLYILDSWFPQEGGTVLCQRIREFDPQTQIVFYSGSALLSDRNDALHAGADAFVAKPYFEELLETVHRLLSGL